MGRDIIDGISVLRPEWIIPFKAKAWIDLQRKESVDSRNIKKHRNDIIRIASELVLSPVDLPEKVKEDMKSSRSAVLSSTKSRVEIAFITWRISILSLSRISFSLSGK